MASTNRFQALQGWEEDMQGIFDDEDSQTDGTEVIDDDNRRRKVSTGPREAHAHEMTFAFPPVRLGVPGNGRGGGCRAEDGTTFGTLPPIIETAEGDTEGPVDYGMDDQVAASNLAGIVPPTLESQEQASTTFTYRAQLTWGLEAGKRVNLPQLFREWVYTSSKHIPNFALLPFDEEKGQVITTAEQIPDDNPSFYTAYYHNHRVLNHGNMTGMVHFQCTVSWNKIKRMKEPYFQWLHQTKVYLNLTKFKSATLIVCGFLVGAHPGHLRRDDAEAELRKRLNLQENFPFQLTARTISVPKDSAKLSERYSFPVVSVETTTSHAKQLREAFFALPKPVDAALSFPYTGPYQFVPMLQSKEWPVHKIYQLAKIHVRMCDTLRAIYVHNLQDIRNEIGPKGQTLMRGFLGMTTEVEGGGTKPLINSIHNTGRAHVKVILVPQQNYEQAIEQLAVLHQTLTSGVPPAYHRNVFVDNLEAGLTSGHRDTIHSCNSSQHANELLHLYNPQDAEEEPPINHQKRFRPSVISYASVVGGNNDVGSTSATTVTMTTPSQSQPQVVHGSRFRSTL